ncbi:unnamed protein product [Ixodes pacificus]
MAEQGDVLRQSSCPPRRHIRPRSRGWAAALWSLTITTAVLLLVSIVITAFVTTTLLNPSLGRRQRAPPPSELPNLTSQSRRGLLKAGDRQTKPCDSIACIERAKLLLRQINKSRDPCDDFYAYVCNDWKLTRPLSPGADRVSMDTVLVDAYADLVASQLQDTGSQFPELEFLVDRCLHPEPELFDDLLAMFLDATDMRPWMTGLAKMRLPPAELSRTLGLAFRQLAIDSIFRFSVSNDILNKTKRFIALGEPSTVLLHGPLEDGEYELVHLGFSPVLNILRKFVETDVLRFEDRISRLFGRPQLDSAAMADCIIIKVRDLPTVQGIEWTDLLQSVFGKGLRPITSRTYIKLTSPDYVVRLARGDLLISSRDFMGYLLFRMIMVLSPLMKDDKVRNVLASISYARHPEFAQPLSQAHYCIHLMNRFELNLPLYVSHRITSDLLGGDAAVQDLISTLRHVFLEHFHEELGRPGENLKAVIQDKLVVLYWESLIPRVLKNASQRADYTDGIYTGNSRSSTAQFFYTWIRKSLEKRLLARMDSRVVHPGWTGGFLSAEPRLEPPYESIEIPPPVFDFFLDKDPALRPIQAARVAPKIYRSLFRTIYHWIYNFEFENGTHVARHLEDLRLCLESQYSALLWLDKQVQLNASRTSWADLWDFMALRPSLEAFLLLASRVSSNYRLRLLEHWTTSQLFFVFYAANFCENSDRRFLRRLVAHGPNSPAWFRVNGPLRNFPEFQKAFGCRRGLFMNPSNQCTLRAQR